MSLGLMVSRTGMLFMQQPIVPHVSIPIGAMTLDFHQEFSFFTPGFPALFLKIL